MQPTLVSRTRGGEPRSSRACGAHSTAPAGDQHAEASRDFFFIINYYAIPTGRGCSLFWGGCGFEHCFYSSCIFLRNGMLILQWQDFVWVWNSPKVPQHGVSSGPIVLSGGWISRVKNPMKWQMPGICVIGAVNIGPKILRRYSEMARQSRSIVGYHPTGPRGTGNISRSTKGYNLQDC